MHVEYAVSEMEHDTHRQQGAFCRGVIRLLFGIQKAPRTGAFPCLWCDGLADAGLHTPYLGRVMRPESKQHQELGKYLDVSDRNDDSAWIKFHTELGAAEHHAVADRDPKLLQRRPSQRRPSQRRPSRIALEGLEMTRSFLSRKFSQQGTDHNHKDLLAELQADSATGVSTHQIAHRQTGSRIMMPSIADLSCVAEILWPGNISDASRSVSLHAFETAMASADEARESGVPALCSRMEQHLGYRAAFRAADPRLSGRVDLRGLRSVIERLEKREFKHRLELQAHRERSMQAMLQVNAKEQRQVLRARRLRLLLDEQVGTCSDDATQLREKLIELIALEGPIFMCCERATLYLVGHRDGALLDRIATVGRSSIDEDAPFVQRIARALGISPDGSDDLQALQKAILWSRSAKPQHVGIDPRSIAGTCAALKQIERVSDATRDPRFNPRWDDGMDYMTQSITCVPVVHPDHSDLVLGCIQLTNKLDLDHQGDIITFDSVDADEYHANELANIISLAIVRSHESDQYAGKDQVHVAWNAEEGTACRLPMRWV